MAHVPSIRSSVVSLLSRPTTPWVTAPPQARRERMRRARSRPATAVVSDGPAQTASSDVETAPVGTGEALRRTSPRSCPATRSRRPGPGHHRSRRPPCRRPHARLSARWRSTSRRSRGERRALPRARSAGRTRRRRRRRRARWRVSRSASADNSANRRARDGGGARRSERRNQHDRRGRGWGRRRGRPRGDSPERVDPARGRELRDRQRQQPRTSGCRRTAEVEIGFRRGRTEKLDPHVRTIAGEASSGRAALTAGAHGGDLDSDQLAQARSVDLGTTLQGQIDDRFRSRGPGTRLGMCVSAGSSGRRDSQKQKHPPEGRRAHSIPPCPFTAARWGPAG